MPPNNFSASTSTAGIEDHFPLMWCFGDGGGKTSITRCSKFIGVQVSWKLETANV